MTIQEAINVLENVISFDYTEETEAIGVVLKALAELKESKKEDKNLKWKPTYGDDYWFRNVSGSFEVSNWEDDDIDAGRYKNIPLFITEEECRKYWNFMDTVKEKSYEFSKEEWEDDEVEKFSIGYIHVINDFAVTYDDCKYLGKIYFKTHEDAQYIIDKFKEELLKYWL